MDILRKQMVFLDLAKSRRSMCVFCEKNIKKNEFRIKYRNYFHHVHCLIKIKRIRSFASCIEKFPGYCECLHYNNNNINNVSLSNILFPKKIPSNYHIKHFTKKDLKNELRKNNIKFKSNEYRSSLQKKLYDCTFRRIVSLLFFIPKDIENLILRYGILN